ncbi:MAG: response regulator transcription factor [Clostridia bacterium]|nr:response regulator transcription factor [Clostridia bacterium]
MKKLFVIEDDSSIRELIRMALVSFSYEVTVFDNAEDAMAAIAKTPPDLCIFDIMLPGMSGLDALRKLRAVHATAKLPVIMLTAKDTELDKITGLDFGADDYITKPFSVMELGARVRAALRRAEPQAEEDLTAADITINQRTREVICAGQKTELTFKEYELLCFLIINKARIVPREELLRAVWGTDFIGESRTLDMHIRTLRQKLNDDADDPRYIKTVRYVGYRFIG